MKHEPDYCESRFAPGLVRTRVGVVDNATGHGEVPVRPVRRVPSLTFCPLYDFGCRTAIIRVKRHF